MFFENIETFENSSNRSISRLDFSCFFAEITSARRGNNENIFLKCHLLMVFLWNLYTFLQKSQFLLKKCPKERFTCENCTKCVQFVDFDHFRLFRKKISKSCFSARFLGEISSPRSFMHYQRAQWRFLARSGGGVPRFFPFVLFFTKNQGFERFSAISTSAVIQK